MKFFQRISTDRTGEEGFGLLFGLFAMAIVGVIGWSMVTNGLVDMTISDNYRSRSTAFYAADAGLEQTVIDMKVDDAWVSSLVDTSDWTAVDPAPASFTINGNTVSVTLDGGEIEPGYYPIGSPATLGEGTYVREIYLPITITPLGDDDDDDGEEEDGSSEDSGSGDSGSHDSGSHDSGSEGSGSRSGDSDSGSHDSGSGSGGFFASVGHSLAALLAPRRLLLAASLDDGDTSDDDSGTEKVTVCHIPPGNPDARHTIVIGAPAWPAHEAHGDHQGSCSGDDDSDEDECEDGSGDSASSGSGSGGVCDDLDGDEDGDDDSSEPDATVTVSLRSTGSGGNAESATQVLRADLEIDLNDDGSIADVRVRNWVQER